MENLEADLNPLHEAHTIKIFCWAVFANSFQGAIYTNTTGKFPSFAMDSMQYVFVANDDTKNAILVTYLANVFKPFFNVLYNKASKAIMDFL